VAGVDVRIAEAEAALATPDAAIGKSTRSLLERDGAILRLIYTFEAVWKASQQLLAEHEGITGASPNATIRAARRLADSRTRMHGLPSISAMTVMLRFTCTAVKLAPKSNSISRPCRSASTLARGFAAAGSRRKLSSYPKSGG
jgi:hypothetical protein